MKEIKYINHSLRGALTYIALAVSVNLIYNFSAPLNRLVPGFLVFVIGYLPVYFFNDYTDRVEDAGNNKSNLYNLIPNHKFFWSLASIFLLTGLIGALYFSSQVLLLLVGLYGWNFLYSGRPFRLRDKFAWREITIFCLNITKWYLVLALLGFDLSQSPTPIMLFVSSTLAALTVIYKRTTDLRRSNLMLYLFGSISALSWGVSLWLYPQIFLLFVPLFPIAIFLHVKYENRPAPNSKYLLAYIIYFAAVVLLTKT